jgi:hypothetical protein
MIRWNCLYDKPALPYGAVNLALQLRIYVFPESMRYPGSAGGMDCGFIDRDHT